MEDKLKAIEARYSHIQAQLGASETYGDPALVAKLNKEQRDLEPVVTAFLAFQKAKRDMAEAQALMSDPELKDIACSFLVTPTTTKASSWSCGPEWAARNPPSLPTPCFGCTPCMPSPRVGAWRSCPPMRQSWGA